MFIKDKIYTPGLPASANVKTEHLLIVNALQVELLPHYVHLSPELVNTLVSIHDTEHLKELIKTLLSVYTFGKLTRPLYEDWTSTSNAGKEFHVENGMYTWRCGTEALIGQDFRQRLMKFSEGYGRSFKLVTKATKDEADTFVRQYLDSPVMKNTAEANYNMTIMPKYFPEYFSGYIKNHFIRGWLAGIRGANAFDTMQLQIHDVMRIYATRKDHDYWNLNTDTTFANPSWSERKALMAFLAKQDPEKLSEAFGRDRRLWRRFFKHIHVVGQKPFDQQFPEVMAIIQTSLGFKLSQFRKKAKKYAKEVIEEGTFDTLVTGRVKYRTFASRMNTAIANFDVSTISKLVTKNPTYFFKNINTVLRGVPEPHFVDFLMETVRPVLTRIPVKTLLDIVVINPNATLKIMDIKGKTVIEEVSYPANFRAVQSVVLDYLRVKLNMKFVLGDDVAGKIPTILADTYSQVKRGEMFTIPRDGTNNFIHIFTHWVQNDRTVDLDLSLLVVEKNGSSSIVSWQNYGNLAANHSGDIRAAPAPDGATEYIAIDTRNPVLDSVSYIAPVVIVYSEGLDFSDCQEATIGFKVDSGRQFTLERNNIGYNMDVTGRKCKMVIPFILDFQLETGTVLDYQLDTRESLVQNVKEDIDKLYLAMKQTNKPTVGYLAQLLSVPVPQPNTRYISLTGANMDEVFNSVVKTLN